MAEVLTGRWASLVVRQQPLANLVHAYLHSPSAFRRQFGRPVQDLDTVLDLAQAALEDGFSSYFDVHLRDDGSVIGHIRVDWSLQEEGLISLHGGSPLEDPQAPGHRRRAHARARQEAWLLMVRAALATPGVQRVGTATALSNRAAQAFIAASGFRRTRILQLPDGRETLVHYRVVREWFDAACDGQLPAPPASGNGLAPYRPLPGISCDSNRVLAPTTALEAVPTPPGWTPIDEAGAPRWIDTAATAFLRGLADSVPEDARREDVVQALYFEAAHGTQFFGRAATPNADATAQALISIKPLPRRPGWWLLRGGPLSPGRAPVSLRPWLDTCFAREALRRVEAQVPADRSDSLAWWRACGLPDEGITEIDRHGQPLAYTLARVAT